MEIITKDRATKIRLRFLVFAFVTVALIAFLFLTDYVKQREIPIAVIVVGVLIYIYYSLKRFMYFNYNDESEKVTIKYFNLIPTALEHHVIEIPKKSLVSFEVKKTLFGFREEIIFVQKIKNGIAKYPPISISILNNTEKRALTDSLYKISNSNKR